jgi:copper chaperone CopZ
MENEKKQGEGLESSVFKITGICSCEGKIVEKKMKNLEGVVSYSLNAITNQLKVTYDPKLVTIEGIKKSVAKAGATATLMKSDQIF